MMIRNWIYRLRVTMFLSLLACCVENCFVCYKLSNLNSCFTVLIPLFKHICEWRLIGFDDSVELYYYWFESQFTFCPWHFECWLVEVWLHIFLAWQVYNLFCNYWLTSVSFKQYFFSLSGNDLSGQEAGEALGTSLGAMTSLQQL